MKVAIAGAAGFIGQRIISDLIDNTDFEVVAITRQDRFFCDHPRVEIRLGDVYSLLDAERVLAGCDAAVYLIHSMSPSSRLSQGTFADMDYILADNFARAASDAGVGHIVYVGGIIPDRGKASDHLLSRLEVERVLSSRDIPITSLRCSLIIGSRGSSFDILKKLVERLPFMALPRWIYTHCQPVHARDVAEVARRAIAIGPDKARGVYDVGAPEVWNYRELIVATARALGRDPLLLDIPLITLPLSQWWVHFVSGASKALVFPLIDSLLTPMMVSPDRELPDFLQPDWLDVREALKLATSDSDGYEPVLKKKTGVVRSKVSDVRSVQRLRIPHNRDAYWAARTYMKFLPLMFSFFVLVKRRGDEANFHLSFMPWPLLTLKFAPDRSSPERQLFYVTGGLLAKPSKRARLEFRLTRGRAQLFAAIHEFRPRLPWAIYVCTQALGHAFVMWRFGVFLERFSQKYARRDGVVARS